MCDPALNDLAERNAVFQRLPPEGERGLRRQVEAELFLLHRAFGTAFLLGRDGLQWVVSDAFLKSSANTMEFTRKSWVRQ